MLNYKTSVHTTAQKTTKKSINTMHTIGEFRTENTLMSPSHDNRASQKHEIMKNIEGIINDVAKKATDSRNAVETVQNVNSEIVDVLAYGRSPSSPNVYRQTSMEHLIDPEGEAGERHYYVPDVPMSASVGPNDRMGGNLNNYHQPNQVNSGRARRYRSPNNNINSSINSGFGSPSGHQNNQGLLGSSGSYGYTSPNRNLGSPTQKYSYDQTEEGSGYISHRNVNPNGLYSPNGARYNRHNSQGGYMSPQGYLQGFDGHTSPEQYQRQQTGEFGRRQRGTAQPGLQGQSQKLNRNIGRANNGYEQQHNFDYSRLQSSNKPVPEQPLHQFQREDLIAYSEDLRRKLNDEIERNGLLLDRCQELEHSNSQLRGSSRKESENLSNFARENYHNYGALRNVSNSGNGAQFDIWAELKRLKEDNEKLRKQTVHLLKKNH